jgi:hypothetical protein
MVTPVGYSMVGRSGGRVTLCVICTVHVETRSAGFLVGPQNQGRWFVRGLASKPLGWFLPVWPQNHSDGFSRFGIKTEGTSFSVWASKPTATTQWFGHQNLRDDFLIWASKPSGLRFVSCAIKPMGGCRWRGARVEI